jgi:hypothetical protein
MSPSVPTYFRTQFYFSLRPALFPSYNELSEEQVHISSWLHPTLGCLVGIRNIKISIAGYRTSAHHFAQRHGACDAMPLIFLQYRLRLQGMPFFQLAVQQATAADILQYGYPTGSAILERWWEFPGKIILVRQHATSWIPNCT